MDECLSPDDPQTRRLDTATVALLKKHFWCDFSDVIAALKWDETDNAN